jgi:hypothetical protein
VGLDQLAAAFNDTFARLEASFGQLEGFTADVSHELRTPLTAPRSVGEVGLRGSCGAEDYREVIGSMLEEVDRLTRLTGELLTLARADAGDARLRVEEVDLGPLAREVAGHLPVLAEEKEQALAVDAADIAVQADRTVLRQALVNLVVNAIKYSPERTRIRLVVRRRGTAGVLEVADEGPGIALEHWGPGTHVREDLPRRQAPFAGDGRDGARPRAGEVGGRDARRSGRAGKRDPGAAAASASCFPTASPKRPPWPSDPAAGGQPDMHPGPRRLPPLGL